MRVAAIMAADGTVRVDDVANMTTVDQLVRAPFRVHDKLVEICDQLGIAGLAFPRPIAEQIHRRDGMALRRYRGAHRTGCWSVAALTKAVAARRGRRPGRPPTRPASVMVDDRRGDVHRV